MKLAARKKSALAVAETGLAAWLASESVRPFVSWGAAIALHVTVALILAGFGLFGAGGPDEDQGPGLKAGIVHDTGEGRLKGPGENQTPAVSEVCLTTSVPDASPPLSKVSSLPAPQSQPVKIIGIGQPAADNPVKGEWGSVAIGASGGGSTGAGASFFGIRARGRNFVYIVDCSGSMNGVKLVEAKHELLSSIAELRSRQRFFVFFYETRTHLMPGKQMIKASSRAKKMCQTWVGDIRSQGGTAPLAALLAAIKMKPDIIFFMSDGLFSETVCDKVKRIQAQTKGRVTIHTIGFASRDGERVLTRLAEENNGRYRFVPAKRWKKRHGR